MARTNKTQFAILGFLTKRPMSGYDMQRILEKISRFHWSESNAQLYPILKRLETNAMVTSQIDAASGERKRRLYSITDLGRQAILDWLKRPIELPKYREEILLKLSLGYNLPVSQSIKHVQNYQEELLTQVKYLETIEEHLRVDHAGLANQPFLLIVFHHNRLVIEAKLKWCEDTLLKLAKITETVKEKKTVDSA